MERQCPFRQSVVSSCLSINSAGCSRIASQTTEAGAPIRDHYGANNPEHRNDRSRITGVGKSLLQSEGSIPLYRKATSALCAGQTKRILGDDHTGAVASPPDGRGRDDTLGRARSI